MMGVPALYYERSRISIDSLEKVVLSLVLFSNPVYVNCRFGGDEASVDRKLSELAEAGYIRPWAFPGEAEVGPHATWVRPDEVLSIPDDAYGEFSEAIRESVAEYRRRTEPTSHQRITELVQLANELWGFCIAGHLGSDRIVAAKARATNMLDRVERMGYDAEVAARFLELNGIRCGLAYLSVEDISYLQRRYQDKVSAIITASTRKWPQQLASVGFTERAVQDVMTEYAREVEEFLERRRNKSNVDQLMQLAVNLAGFIFAPIGLWSVGMQLEDWYHRKHDLPLQWFLLETKRRVQSQRP